MKKNGTGPPKDSKGPKDGRGEGQGNFSGSRLGTGAQTGGKKGVCPPVEKK